MNPFRQPGQVAKPKYPRLIVHSGTNAGDLRLIQVDDENFIIEKASVNAMNEVYWSKVSIYDHMTWIMKALAERV